MIKKRSKDRRDSEGRRDSVVDRRLGLDRRRGPGRRLSDDRKAAEEGQMSDEQFEFLMAIDEYKRKNTDDKEQTRENREAKKTGHKRRDTDHRYCRLLTVNC